MWKRRSSRRPEPWLRVNALALALIAAPSVASAANIACNSLTNVIYGQGGSSQKPLIAKFAAALTPTINVVYQSPGACVGINSLIAGTAMSGTASYWSSAGTESTCNLPITGQAINFALMGNTAPNCPGVSSLPDGIADFVGPVNAYNLIVPTGSSQQSISAEAVYFVYGDGAAGQVSPWTDESQLAKRDQNSAATLFLSLATGVPPTAFKGIDSKNNTGTITAVSTATTPEAALGYVSSDVADANRGTTRTLAYQHFGQTCGYWPDTSATTFDKINVRTGQYELWGYAHFFSFVDGNNAITDANTATFIGYFTGATDPGGLDITSLETKSGSVPNCAMNVSRDSDLGPLSSYQPPQPCGCYFEKIATGATACTPCGGNGDCPLTAPVCRNSFCEVQ